MSALPGRASLAFVSTLAGALGLATAAKAEEPARAPVETLDPRRLELAGFPVLGGNSDIGAQFGGVATLTRFYDDRKPYLWNIDLLLSASVKSDQNGVRLVQQSHVLRVDATHLFGGRLRIDLLTSFQRTINAGYYGIGNATTADPSPAAHIGRHFGRRHQYLHQEGRARLIGRVHTGTPADLAFGASLRYVAPEAYLASKLDEDGATRDPAGSRMISGLEPMALAGIAAGLMYDTRDTEFVTTRGIFYQVGVGGTVGSAERVRYGNVSTVLSHYAHLGGPFIFASRLVASMQFGNVPFYDLAQGGTFEPQYMLGSDSGVRGVPQGRYAGLIKIIANVEVRTTLPRFHLFGQRIRPGTTAFFDAGRAWSGYDLDPARDGRKLDPKYGVGGGFFVQWGEAAIFRLEAAYSPDAIAENRHFPIGVYVSDGLMF